MIHKKVQKQDGPYLDILDFTFTMTEGNEVPFAYASDFNFGTAVSSYSLHGTNIRFPKEIKTIIEFKGSRVRKSLDWTPNCIKKGLDRLRL